jgi:lysine-N-methylase
MSTLEVLQPQYFKHFRCTGAECEDTCCDGWGIIIDRETYEKYQDPGLGLIAGAKLSSLVEINAAGSSATDFAKIRLAGTRCPALSEGLCCIQESLGEPYLSDTCSSYPRVRTVANGVLEQSLHLSCPEAARLVLTNPGSMMFQGGQPGSPRALHALFPWSATCPPRRAKCGAS